MLRHVLSIKDFNHETLTRFLSTCSAFAGRDSLKFSQKKILATLFFEPSTRTRLSFESAMLQLDGAVISCADDKSSSVQKGETIYDTIKTVSGYCDAIVIRHPIEGSARLAAEASDIPIINAGDGSISHPSQSLVDAFSIKNNLAKLDGLNIGYMGDLKYGRTIHSLVETMAMFHRNKHYFIAADPSLQIEKDNSNIVQPNRIFYPDSLNEVIKELDVLYVTRLQKERFHDQMEFNRIIKKYRITPESLAGAKKQLMVMHPLPRNDEISREVDSTSHAYYFKQAHNGIIVRKALLYQLIQIGGIK